MSNNNQQIDGREERSNAGLPDATEYDPEAIGTANLKAGDPEQTHPEYGLELVPVLHDDEDTGVRLVRRNGEYLDRVSEGYKLLPNERVVEVANEVARDVGASPFHEFDGDWFVELDDHVFQDPERRRVHAAYAFDQGVIGNDEMEYGFILHNSIDGSMSFNVGLFSFRHACQNMVMMGVSSFPERVEEEREILNQDKRKHTSGFDIEKEALKARIESTMMLVDDVEDAYTEWTQRQITPDQAERIIDYFPEKDLPAWMEKVANDLELFRDDEEHEEEEYESKYNAHAATPNEIVERFQPGSETAWDTYNSLTEAVWHSDDNSDTTKQRKFKKLHRAMPISDHVA